MKRKSIKASEFDRKFDSGEDMLVFINVNKASRPGFEHRRVSVDFSVWMVQRLDKISKRLGVTRQSVIKVFISEKLKEENV